MGSKNFAPLLSVGDEYDLSPYSGRNIIVHAQRYNTGYTYTFNIDLVSGFTQERIYGLIIPTGHGEISITNPYQLFKITADPSPKLVPVNYQDGQPAQISYFSGDDIAASEVHWESLAQDSVTSSAFAEGTTATITLYRSGPASSELILDLSFIQGTAHADDVISFPAQVTMAAGETQVDVDVVLDGGPEYEDNQSFLINAVINSAPGGETWAGSTARQITILETSPQVPDTTVYGCMDPLATNYNPLATDSDGSCTYPAGGVVGDCLLLGDLFEVEHWFKVWFVAPDNGEQLHDQDLIEYNWSGTWEQMSEVDLYAYSEKNRVAMFKYTKTLALSDSEVPVTYDVTALAKDTRFTTLEVTDEDSETVNFNIPCILEGNTPGFSISDLTVTEPSSGTAQAMMTITASEAVLGLPITIDYCSSDITATSFSSSVEVQHVAYDQNTPPEPFLSYLDYGDVRVVFDASFPKFYNTRYTAPEYALAYGFLTNAVNWMNRKGGSKALFIGERDHTRANTNGMPGNIGSSEYDIKGTGTSGFYNSIRPHLESMGYTTDVIYSWDFGANPGYPTAAEFMDYDVIIYMSSWYMDQTLSPLSSVFISSLESAVRQRTGLMIITDHTAGDKSSSFAAAGNDIAARFFAEFSGSINRSVGTDFDAVRTTYGDHPLITGLTGVMPGDTSEGKVETNALTVEPDYEPACGTVTFNEGDITKQVPVTINTDNLYEDSETLRMTLSNISRGTIGDGEGILTIDEWIVPEIQVTLASQGAKKQLFVGRDTSGSTDADEVTINGVPDQSRRQLMEKIMTDYDLASCQSPTVEGHGNDGCSDNANPLSHYTGVSGATSALTVGYINSIQASIDGDTQEVSILVMNDSSDAISHDNTIWSSDWAWIGSLGIPVTMTFIRVIGQSHIDNDTGNYQAARLWFESVVAAAPANVTAYFKSFSSYTTGAAGDLNDILSSTVNNDYNAVCNARPGDVTVVSAPDEAAALALAQGSMTCP